MKTSAPDATAKTMNRNPPQKIAVAVINAVPPIVRFPAMNARNVLVHPVALKMIVTASRAIIAADVVEKTVPEARACAVRSPVAKAFYAITAAGVL